jgi:hypothetical protein
MVAWRKGWKRDVSEPARASATTSYSGHELPEETQRSDLQQRARIRAAQALSNAASELSDRAQECDDAGLPLIGSEIRRAANVLMNQSNDVKPPRPVIG